tara:strand:- start:66 stop:311 length:246 start_codon:yes stop_codon:yes gene_type:complete
MATITEGLKQRMIENAPNGVMLLKPEWVDGFYEIPGLKHKASIIAVIEDGVASVHKTRYSLALTKAMIKLRVKDIKKVKLT